MHQHDVSWRGTRESRGNGGRFAEWSPVHSASVPKHQALSKHRRLLEHALTGPTMRRTEPAWWVPNDIGDRGKSIPYFAARGNRGKAPWMSMAPGVITKLVAIREQRACDPR